MCCVVCAGGGRGGSGVEVRRRATTRVSAPYGRPGTAYETRLGHCCRAADWRLLPPPGRGPSPCVPDGSHGHAVGPWRRAGVAVPHLALISLEAASRSSRRVKTVVSSHRSYDPRIAIRYAKRYAAHIGRHGPRRMAYLMCRHMIARRRAYRRPYKSVQYVYRYIDAHHPPQLAPPPSRRHGRRAARAGPAARAGVTAS